MNIIPSVPVKQPSDAASVSADTMMNSYRHPSHRKELFSFRTFHNQERGTILDPTQSFPDGPAAIIVDSVSCWGVFEFLFSCH